MQLRRRYKYIKRYRKIANVLLKHGFGHIAHRLGLSKFLSVSGKIFSKRESSTERFSLAEKVRMAMEELGPTFVKTGQILSTRSDLIPPGLYN